MKTTVHTDKCLQQRKKPNIMYIMKYCSRKYINKIFMTKKTKKTKKQPHQPESKVSKFSP